MLKVDQEHIGRELREIWCDAAAAAGVDDEATMQEITADIMRRTDVLHEYLLGYDLVEGLAEV
jgi:hypothetical protein